MAEFEFRKLGFSQFRIRCHENMARLEFLPAEMEKAWNERDLINKICRDNGFNYVAIDLTGYRTGSMNEVLSKEQKIRRNHSL
jgi:uncharacterized protein